MTPSRDDSRWFARRSGIVRGPFTDEYLARYILLGRIRLDDELSLDRVRWRAARDYPRLFPPEPLQASGRDDHQRLMAARMAIDERRAQRRMTQPGASRSAGEERRLSPERRERANGEDVLNYSRMHDLMHHPHRVNNTTWQPLLTVLLAMLLMTLVFAYFGMSVR